MNVFTGMQNLILDRYS